MKLQQHGQSKLNAAEFDYKIIIIIIIINRAIKHKYIYCVKNFFQSATCFGSKGPTSGFVSQHKTEPNVKCEI